MANALREHRLPYLLVKPYNAKTPSESSSTAMYEARARSHVSNHDTGILPQECFVDLMFRISRSGMLVIRDPVRSDESYAILTFER